MKTETNKNNEILSCGCCKHSRRDFLSNCAKGITLGAFSGFVAPTLFAVSGCASDPNTKVRDRKSVV